MADTQSQMVTDIDLWVEGELSDGHPVPDYWDDLVTSERLADYLTFVGWTKAPR